MPGGRGSGLASQDARSLYERLDGVYSIVTVVDDFIDRIMVDPRLNANPKVSGDKKGKPAVLAGELRISKPGADKLPAVILIGK
jgi:hypothetical protein